MKSSLIVSCFVVLLVTLVYADGQIDIAYSPYTISQPGSYIVVKDLTTAQNLTCITIQTSNVTIDLNGHTLYGAGNATGSSGNGIAANAQYFNISITNGVVRDFRWSGIEVWGNNVQITKVKAIGNWYAGLDVYGSGNNNGLLADNIAQGNLNYGIIARYNFVVRGNIAESNGLEGILADQGSTVTGNNAYRNGSNGIFTGNCCTVIKNTVSNNTVNGIKVFSGCTVTDNSSYGNTQSGIYTDDGCTVIGNTSFSNTQNGIRVNNGCTVKDNTVKSNGIDGIVTVNSGQIFNNTCYSNSTSGIHTVGDSNSISQNLCTGNTGYGLWSTVTTNYFEQNKLRANGTNKSLGGSTEGAGVLANVIF